MIDVWIIEDVQVVREAFCGLINGAPGMSCSRTFESCETALDALATVRSPRVILLDIELPGMSGLDGVAKFKARAPHSEIVMVTVHDDPPTVIRAICAGASGYLLKESDPDLILKSILEVAAGGAPMSPAIARFVLHLFARFVPHQSDYKLSPRETQVLQFLVDGCTKKEIAWEMHLSYHTIDKHVRSTYEKLQVNSVSAAVAKALRENLVDQ